MAIPAARTRRAGPATTASRRHRGSEGPRTGSASRRQKEETGSRERLLEAAAAEFAARGFAGANVDRIAAAARVNKAMLYYHFKSKAALYQEIVGGMFQAVGSRIRDVAASNASPEAKLGAFIETIACEAEARPHFPPIWLREVAEGGTHLEDATLRDIAVIIKTLVTILQAGVQARRFKPVHPLLVHGGIVGPILFFFATASLRHRLERLGVKGAARFGRGELVSHVTRLTLGALEGKM